MNQMNLNEKDATDVAAALHVEQKIRKLAASAHLPEHHMDRARADARKGARQFLSGPAQLTLQALLRDAGILKIDLTPAEPGWLGSLGGEPA
jgi:hypothetical protein